MYVQTLPRYASVNMSLKKLTQGATVLLILLLGIFTLLVSTVDINHYKPEIIAAVEHMSGRTLKIAGDISFHPSFLRTSLDSKS